ncbi:hypothetical protein GOODEAATRI_026751, partial [Goodea atripinnis]
LSGASLPHSTLMTTSQRESSSGVEYEPQQDPDWVGLVISSESTSESVCDWLQEQGLGLYVNMARVWISSGQTLLQASQQDLERWTNHRVMEWLRSVDLAEYAPNLRGSGVHGGLMVLEPRFNVETMALLLNIPPNKTLLRRHLATHFSLLIGSEAQQLKQECLENPDYTLLTATTKVKVICYFLLCLF